MRTNSHGARTKNKKANNGANLGFEENLWKVADKMRNNMEAAARWERSFDEARLLKYDSNWKVEMATRDL
jgi:hypothetical protein